MINSSKSYDLSNILTKYMMQSFQIVVNLVHVEMRMLVLTKQFEDDEEDIANQRQSSLRCRLESSLSDDKVSFINAMNDLFATRRDKERFVAHSNEFVRIVDVDEAMIAIRIFAVKIQAERFDRVEKT